MENKKEEIWRPVVGYETIYEVSSFGNIRNCNTGHPKKIRYDKNKFGVVRLHKNGLRYWKALRVIIGESFLDYNTKEPLTSVIKKDINNPSNNVDNFVVDKFFCNGKTIGLYTIKDSFKCKNTNLTKIIGTCQHGKDYELFRGSLYNKCKCYITEKRTIEDLEIQRVPLIKINNRYWFFHLLILTQGNASSRTGNRSINELTQDIIIDKYLEQKGRSYYFNTPFDLTFRDNIRRISVDRIDNSKGYTKDNIVLANIFENRGRGDEKFEKFKFFCNQLVHK